MSVPPNEMTDTTVLDTALSDLEADEDGLDRKAKEAEASQVRSWFKKVDAAREFDKNVRAGFATDRLAARGLTPQEVSVPVIGGNIDTLKSFIYAQNPSVDCAPSQMVEAPKLPPPIPPVDPTAELLAGLTGAGGGGEVAGGGIGNLLSSPIAEGVLPAASSGGLEAGGVQLGMNIARAQEEFQAQMQAFNAEMAAWTQDQVERRQKKLERNLFAQTMEIVISKLWKKTNIKRKARKAVGSTLTVCVGWAKPMWIERTERDPQVDSEINDLMKLATRIEDERRAITEGWCRDEDEALLGIADKLKALRERVFVTTARGFVIDFVPAENVQTPIGTDVMDCADGPWMSEFMYKSVADCIALFGGDKKKDEKIRNAQRFQKVEPERNNEGEASALAVTENDAEQYQTSENVTAGQKPSDDDFLQVMELSCIDDGTVYTGIRGMDCWAKPPAPPNVKSSRFYNLFPLCFVEVDGQRYPTSLVSRSVKLQNERNGRRSALRIARQRSLPAVFFDDGEIDATQMDKIRKSESQEYVGVRTTTGKDMSACFAPKPVISIDPTLYDTAPIDRDIETVWGTQSAITGGGAVADKTATEAEIEQGGFQSRTGQMRDSLEDWLSEIAQYTATIAVQYLTLDDVMVLAGPDAVWPTLDTPEELEQLMDIDIRAGSTGKPNSRSEREAWNAAMPLITQAQNEIAQLRGASPSEVADGKEALVQKTFDVMGGKEDIGRYIPQNENMSMDGGMGAPMGAPPVQPPTMTPMPTETADVPV